nr:Arm DNA-binding domain-containing protein [Acinetobacter sp. TUM15064]
MSLTDVMCKKALPQEKQYRLSDINGLSLRVDPNGKKYWSNPTGFSKKYYTCESS